LRHPVTAVLVLLRTQSTLAEAVLAAAGNLRVPEGVVAKYGLEPHIRFGTEVTGAEFEEDRGLWRISVWPDIPGRERFAGNSFHSALWDHDHDLTGRRVAVIGTGASAIQFVPEIQPRAGPSPCSSDRRPTS
jgi:cation diffusion facilitator CzcD-associated flavoprotein CzcO